MTAPLRPHDRQYRADAVQGTEKVDVKGEFPVGVGDVGIVPGRGAAGGTDADTAAIGTVGELIKDEDLTRYIL